MLIFLFIFESLQNNLMFEYKKSSYCKSGNFGTNINQTENNMEVFISIYRINSPDNDVLDSSRLFKELI